MAQGEFWVERQNWARWPRVLKVNSHTERGTETRRYLPERHEAAWNEREYAVGKIAELEAENAKLRELVCWMYDLMDESCAVQHPYAPAPISYDRLLQAQARARDFGVDVP